MGDENEELGAVVRDFAEGVVTRLRDRLDLESPPASAFLMRAQVAELSDFAEITPKKWAAAGRGPRIARIGGLP